MFQIAITSIIKSGEKVKSFEHYKNALQLSSQIFLPSMFKSCCGQLCPPPLQSQQF